MSRFSTCLEFMILGEPLALFLLLEREHWDEGQLAI